MKINKEVMDMTLLDPDFRKEPPRNPDGTYKPFCCRCRKEIKDISKALKVTVNWETWEVLKGHDRAMEPPNKVVDNEFLGPDCAKKIGLS